ncbi:hypothetical protein [Kitasatospora paranensis]|uniref:Guanylate cyclase domain-containing protein n=1 Tax=Kitasatospora paranensis TaxID=258053 RepID=A0ABW2G8G8_9ACTN
MNDKDRFARHLVIGVDAKGYSSHDAVGQDELQQILLGLLDRAAAAVDLDRSRWTRQPQGDCEFSLVPPDQPEPRIVDDFVRELDAALDRHNHSRLPEFRLRLRVAAHFGVAYPSDTGFAGQAAVVTARLLNSAELKAALADTPEADVVLMLSDRVYTDVVANRHVSTRPSEFGRVEMALADYTGPAWIRRLRRSGPPTRQAAGPAAPGLRPSAAEGGPHAPAIHHSDVQNTFHGPVTAEVIGINLAGRDGR